MGQGDYRCAFIVLYFGKIPDYFEFWARSCETNAKHFHWFVYNDTIQEPLQFNNAITIIPYTFETLCLEIEAFYDVSVPAANRRIVCDYELLLYALRNKNESFDAFEFVGFTDLDVVYGTIKPFLPQDAWQYSLISADDNRPCGPFMLFNKRYLKAIFNDERIRSWLQFSLESEVWRFDGADERKVFEPITGNRKKDSLLKGMHFRHLDESEMLVDIAKQYAPVHCQADPLQPTMTRGFNFRKAFAIWEEGVLNVYDNRGHRKEGAFFHFSRLKNKKRFKVDGAISRSRKWGVYKYGMVEMMSPFTFLRMWLSLLY